jgi:hypothetical protein
MALTDHYLDSPDRERWDTADQGAGQRRSFDLLWSNRSLPNHKPTSTPQLTWHQETERIETLAEINHGSITRQLTAGHIQEDVGFVRALREGKGSANSHSLIGIAVHQQKETKTLEKQVRSAAEPQR